MGLNIGGSSKKTKLIPAPDYDGKFNIKEVSYLLNIIESIDHNGKMLEQALSCKQKLKDSLEKLTKYTE